MEARKALKILIDNYKKSDIDPIGSYYPEELEKSINEELKVLSIIREKSVNTSLILGDIYDFGELKETTVEDYNIYMEKQLSEEEFNLIKKHLEEFNKNG